MKYRTQPTSFRFEPAELEQIDAASARLGLSRAAFVRQAALRRAWSLLSSTKAEIQQVAAGAPGGSS